MDPNNMALMPNPSGAPPNFVDPPSLNGAVLGVGLSLVIVSTLCVSLRLYAKPQRPGKARF